MGGNQRTILGGPVASPVSQLSPPGKAPKTGRWHELSILWFVSGMGLILASWIWHVLVIVGVACLVISLVLENHETRKCAHRAH